MDSKCTWNMPGAPWSYPSSLSCCLRLICFPVENNSFLNSTVFYLCPLRAPSCQPSALLFFFPSLLCVSFPHLLPVYPTVFPARCIPTGGLSSAFWVPLVLSSTFSPFFVSIFRAWTLHWARFKMLWDLVVKLEWYWYLYDGPPKKKKFLM